MVVSVLLTLAYAANAYLTASRGIEFTPFYFSTSSGFLFLLAANVGAVIMPFMLFYQASGTAEKCTPVKSLWAVRLETIVGAFISEVIMIAIEIAAVGVNGGSLNFAAPEVLSRALSSVAGNFAPYVFGIGLVAASFVALVVISLGSAWGVTEAMGWGRKNWFKVYLVESFPALLIPLIALNLVNLALSLMVLNLVVLIGPGLMLGLISSNKKLMGSHSLRGFDRVGYWTFLLLMLVSGILGLALA
jgi:Mn2+/Fe2+ NRAMP family transporter